MLNRNFISIIMSQITNHQYLTGIAGNQWDNYQSTFDGAFRKTSLNWTTKLGNGGNNNATFVFGTDDTPATPDDYFINSRIDNNEAFSIISGGYICPADQAWNNQKCILSQIWQYTGNEPVTIKEIGYCVDNSTAEYRIMYDRTVLDSPITVNNGDTFTIALTIGGKATVTVNS